MKIQRAKTRFAWERLEDSRAIKTVRKLLETVSNHDPIVSSEAARGEGRVDHPIRTLRGAVVPGQLTHEHVLGERCHNQSPRKSIGIESEERAPRN